MAMVLLVFVKSKTGKNLLGLVRFQAADMSGVQHHWYKSRFEDDDKCRKLDNINYRASGKGW